MLLLGIDTSADETSVSLLQDEKVISQSISSQIHLQNLWGGIVPMLARRNHLDNFEYTVLNSLLEYTRTQNLPKLNARISKCIKNIKADLLKKEYPLPQKDSRNKVISYQDRETAKARLELKYLETIENPGIELIAVTVGPGLGVALEVGIAGAQMLGKMWGVEVLGVNHIEGHLLSGLLNQPTSSAKELFPALGVVVSGGHSEFVRVNGIGDYEILGETLDDAAGEALDKFAVLTGLGYPGGRKIEELALKYAMSAGDNVDVARRPNDKSGNDVQFQKQDNSDNTTLSQITHSKVTLPAVTASDEASDSINAGKDRHSEALRKYPLPIPMRTSKDYNLSFSGLKTAALYMFEKQKSLEDFDLSAFCFSFQHSVIESLKAKIARILEENQFRAIFAGGGVVANQLLQAELKSLAYSKDIPVFIPELKYLGDNASMIALVGYLHKQAGITSYLPLDRNPGLRLTKKS